MSATTDLTEVLASVPLGKQTLKRVMCTKCDHWSVSYIDAGYGCGYRNTQMLLSSIREDPLLRDTIFNNSMCISFFLLIINETKQPSVCYLLLIFF